MVAMTTSEQAASKSQRLSFRPIQMTSIDDDVTKNPSQNHAPRIAPRNQVASPIKGEENISQKLPAITSAVTKLTTKFQIIFGTISTNFSSPVG